MPFSWIADPAARHGFHRNVAGIRALGLLAFAVFVVRLRSRDHLEWFGMVLASNGFLLTAVDLIEMQTDGRLDQIRLSGREPREFLAAFVAASAGPWTLAALIIIGWSRLTSDVSLSLIETPAIIGALVATIAVATRFGLSQRTVDPRLAVAALIALGVLAGLVGSVDMASLNRLRASTAPGWIMFEALALVWAVRGILRDIAYPPGGPKEIEWGVRLPQRDWMLRWPSIYRGANVASNGVVLPMVLAPTLLVLRFLEPMPAFETAPVYLVPLAIGWVVVSVLCREDAISGRLDFIRQSSTTPVLAALGLAFGLWLPFIVASAILALVLWPVFPATALAVTIGVALWALVAPLPVIEGWARQWPFTYTLPYLMAFALLRGSWPASLTIAALHWWALPRRFAQPDRPSFGRWQSVAATAAICAAAVVMPLRPGPIIAGAALVPIIIATSPLLIDAGSVMRARPWAHPTAIAAVLLAILAPRYGVAAAAAVALSAVLTWIGACRIASLLPGRPVEQAVSRVVLLAAMMIAIVVVDTAGSAALQGSWILGVQGVAVLAIAEGSSRLTARIGRRQPAATLRA